MQADRPLALPIQYGMIRDRRHFSLDLSGITAMIRAWVKFFYTSTLKNGVLLRNISNDISLLPLPFLSTSVVMSSSKGKGFRERIGMEWVFNSIYI